MQVPSTAIHSSRTCPEERAIGTSSIPRQAGHQCWRAYPRLGVLLPIGTWSMIHWFSTLKKEIKKWELKQLKLSKGESKHFGNCRSTPKATWVQNKRERGVAQTIVECITWRWKREYLLQVGALLCQDEPLSAKATWTVKNQTCKKGAHQENLVN